MKSEISNLPSALLVIALCLPAALPYLGGDIPRTNDTLFHYYRAVELDQLVRAGILFPRWGPDLVHGYGYPVFNYFPYLSHYVVVLFHLIGLPFLWALRAAFTAALVGMGLAAYLLGRDLCALLPLREALAGRPAGERRRVGGEAGGLIAAIAYVYSPYVLYTVHVRGGLPESFALVFFPLALWAVWRSILAERPGRFWKPITSDLIAALAVAGFIAAHIAMALQYLPLIGLFGMYAAFVRHSQGSRSSTTDDENTPSPSAQSAFILLGVSALRVGLGISLGLGLTACLWLPSVLELPLVQFQAALARTGLTYTANFFSFSELFAYPPLPVYTDLFNPPLIRSLPLIASGLAILGLLRLPFLNRESRLHYLALFGFFALVCLLITDLSKPVWDTLTILQWSAFPWRYLGPASLLAAALAGAVVDNWLPAPLGVGAVFVISHWTLRVDASHGRFTWSLKFVVCTFIIVSALPFLYAPREAAAENPTRADLARFEILPLLIGTTTTGEFLPTGVKELPDTSEQQNTLAEGRALERLVAPESQVDHLTAEPLRDVYRITAAQAVTLTYNTFYFPGWEATLDGQPLAITPTDPNGMISFNIPAGEHALEIRFGTTPIRAFAGWVSGASLVVVLLLVISYPHRCALGRCWTLRVETRDQRPGFEVSSLNASREVWQLGFWLGGVGFLFLVSLFIFKPGPPQTQHPLALDFGGELTLVGYDQSEISNTAPAGGCRCLKSEITLIWQPQHDLGIPYGMNVRLTDDQGLIYSDVNIERPRDWRYFPGTDHWQPDKFFLDSYILKPLRGTPPGVYHLEAIVYREDNLQALAVQRLGEYEVESPTNEPLADPILTLDSIALISAQADRADAAPGDPYRLTLVWQAISDSPPDQTLALELVDSGGSVIFTRTESIRSQYAPPRWRLGDVLRQEVYFRFPADIPGGAYHWRAGGAELKAPTAIEVNVRTLTRAFEPPPLTHAQTLVVLPSINLLGYNETVDGNTVTIELAWQATAEMSESYRVFLHLLDANGNLVSQSDGEPVNWTRPTTGWVAGEVVMDVRTLDAPGPGKYTLNVGWVNEAGERVAESVRVGAISLAP